MLASMRLSLGFAVGAVLPLVACSSGTLSGASADAGSDVAQQCLDVTQQCRKDCSSPVFITNGCSECPAGSIVASACPQVPQVPVDAGPEEPGNVNPGLYVATCITVLSNKSPQKVLRFYTVATAGKVGTGLLSLTPMRGWESTPPPGAPKPPASASSSETVGQAIQATNVTVGSGTFSATLGAIDVPAEANGISGRPISLDARLQGRMSQGVLRCAGLTGSVTSPVTVELDPETNVCLFKQVAEGDAIPTYTIADFVCQ